MKFVILMNLLTNHQYVNYVILSMILDLMILYFLTEMNNINVC